MPSAVLSPSASTVVPDLVNQQIMEAAKTLLQALFTRVNMPASHGMGHCLTVLAHMEEAVSKAQEGPLHPLLTQDRMLSLRLATLLHEADDHKYFPSDSNNAGQILDEVLSDHPEKVKISSEVQQMISFVSASANGNSVPSIAREDPTFLWPRLCDRLEAIGIIGAIRCYQYNKEAGDPLMLDSTPRPSTVQEVWLSVTEERWRAYQKSGGGSASMMDHYYDKLLQIARFDPEVVNNEYLVEEAERRVQPLVDICLEAGKTGQAPEKRIQALMASS